MSLFKILKGVWEAPARMEFYEKYGMTREQYMQQYGDMAGIRAGARQTPADLANMERDNAREDAKAVATIESTRALERVRNLDAESKDAELIGASGGMRQGEMTDEMFQFSPAGKPFRVGEAEEKESKKSYRSGMGSTEAEYARQLEEKGSIDPGVYFGHEAQSRADVIGGDTVSMEDLKRQFEEEERMSKVEGFTEDREEHDLGMKKTRSEIAENYASEDSSNALANLRRKDLELRGGQKSDLNPRQLRQDAIRSLEDQIGQGAGVFQSEPISFSEEEVQAEMIRLRRMYDSFEQDYNPETGTVGEPGNVRGDVTFETDPDGGDGPPHSLIDQVRQEGKERDIITEQGKQQAQAVQVQEQQAEQQEMAKFNNFVQNALGAAATEVTKRIPGQSIQAPAGPNQADLASKKYKPAEEQRLRRTARGHIDAGTPIEMMPPDVQEFIAVIQARAARR